MCICVCIFVSLVCVAGGGGGSLEVEPIVAGGLLYLSNRFPGAENQC